MSTDETKSCAECAKLKDKVETYEIMQKLHLHVLGKVAKEKEHLEDVIDIRWLRLKDCEAAHKELLEKYKTLQTEYDALLKVKS